MRPRLAQTALAIPGVGFVLCAGLFAGCGPAGASPGADAGEVRDQPDATATGGADAAEASGCSEMDIVFIIDNSVSMDLEQANLIANFPNFIEVLDAYETRSGEPLDYRVAVTTTAHSAHVGYEFGPNHVEWENWAGENGALLSPPECGMGKRWVERSDPNAADAFACAAEVGTRGIDVEMPMRSIERAFSERIDDGINAGFHRSDALLGFVILTDEDDCSRDEDNYRYNCDPDNPALVDPGHYVQFLDGLQGSRERWSAAIIAGPDDCTSEFGDATAAPRLRAFSDEAGANVVFSSICAGSLAPALDDAIRQFGDACRTFPSVD